MSYRLWPAALVATASLAAAGVVVAEHVIETGDGCLGSQYFVATPVSWSAAGSARGKGGPNNNDDKARLVWPSGVDPVGQMNEVPPSGELRMTGCLDIDRIEIPTQLPVVDGRA